MATFYLGFDDADHREAALARLRPYVAEDVELMTDNADDNVRLLVSERPTMTRPVEGPTST